MENISTMLYKFKGFDLIVYKVFVKYNKKIHTKSKF